MTSAHCAMSCTEKDYWPGIYSCTFWFEIGVLNIFSPWSLLSQIWKHTVQGKWKIVRMFDDDFTKWFTYKYGIVCIIFLLVLSRITHCVRHFGIKISFTDTVDFNINKMQHIVIWFLEHASIDPNCKISS